MLGPNAEQHPSQGFWNGPRASGIENRNLTCHARWCWYAMLQTPIPEGPADPSLSLDSWKRRERNVKLSFLSLFPRATQDEFVTTFLADRGDAASKYVSKTKPIMKLNSFGDCPEQHAVESLVVAAESGRL